MQYTKQDQQDAREAMLGRVIPGDRLYTVTRHTSASGMTRSISTFVVRDNQPICIDYRVARLLDLPFDQKHGGCKTSGCGMDMGFHLIYELSRTLFPNGFECVGRDDARRTWCPSNDHTNGDRNYESHHHQDGGYALRQRWL